MVAPAHARQPSFLAQLYDEARYQTTTRGKIIAVSFFIVLFYLLVLGVGAGLFLVIATHPAQTAETGNPTQLLGTADTLMFDTPDGASHSGWFLPGLRGAPIIVVCHGYKSNRSEALTIATTLQQHRYNVFIFNLAGHGDSPDGSTSLGYKESEEVVAAIAMLSRRTDVDTKRIGLWGYNMGAYAAVTAAARTPAVRVIVLDSLFDEPPSLLRMEVSRAVTGYVPLMTTVSVLEFRLWSLLQKRQPSADDSLQKLTGIPKLFITGDDRPDLAEQTRVLSDQAPPPQELVSLPRSNLVFLTDEERLTYDNLVVRFFQQHLPLVTGEF